jgi:hypothetical protein
VQPLIETPGETDDRTWPLPPSDELLPACDEVQLIRTDETLVHSPVAHPLRYPYPVPYTRAFITEGKTRS